MKVSSAVAAVMIAVCIGASMVDSLRGLNGDLLYPTLMLLYAHMFVQGVLIRKPLYIGLVGLICGLAITLPVRLDPRASLEGFGYQGFVISYTAVLVVFSVAVAFIADRMKKGKILFWHLLRFATAIFVVGAVVGAVAFLREAGSESRSYSHPLFSALEAQDAVDRMSEAMTTTVVCAGLAIVSFFVGSLLKRKYQAKVSERSLNDRSGESATNQVPNMLGFQAHALKMLNRGTWQTLIR